MNGKRPDFVPDGMTIDTDGFLYVATFGGSVVYKIDPSLVFFRNSHSFSIHQINFSFNCSDGKIVLEIKLPAEQVTSVAFGGPSRDVLFVTTAAKEFKSPQPPPAGALFKVTGLGATGTPMYSVDLC